MAKIIKHKNSPVSHTILIKNTPQAHKIFGIKNAPNLSDDELSGSSGLKEILDTEESLGEDIPKDVKGVLEDINTSDLAFSDINLGKGI